MKILNFKTINGPNVYHTRPVLVMKIDLELWTDQSSQEIHGFIEKLMATFPGLIEHRCSPGYYGGFYERLLRGTYLAHIIEHIAIELSVLAGIRVRFGKTLYAGQTGYYNIITRFINEEGMKTCLESAFKIVEAMILKVEFNLAEELKKIQFISEKTKLGPSTEAILQAAQKKGIPCHRLGQESLLRLGYGKNIRFVQATLTDRTSAIAVDLVQDKALTKNILQQYNIPVPQGLVVKKKNEIVDAFLKLKSSVAVKPLDGHHGQGVCLNLKSLDSVQEAFFIAQKYSESVLIEEMCFGKDYRILIIDKKMVAAAERIPPFIIGDGSSSVQQLIEKLNQDPRRANGHCGALTKIEIDAILLNTIQMQNENLNSILKKNKKLILRENANLSSGGTAKDVTDLVHSEVRSLCERIARIVNLDICGIDLIHSNVADPIANNLKVIEVNAGPGLRMHLFPNEGQSRNVGEKIIDMLYPITSAARIPIIGVTGTNGKTSIVRMLRKIFSALPNSTVGMTSSDGIWIGQEKVADGDASGPVSALTVLSDSKVDHAILELARGGLLRGGLAYDFSDIGIVTNIRPDHLGQDGIEDLEDLVRIKSLVVEQVKENGYVILNADDEQSLGLMNRKNLFKVSKNIILYSLKPYNPALVWHLKQKKDACWLQGDMIHVMLNNKMYQIGNASSLPISMNGIAQFQISNVLAVVAAAVASGVQVDIIYDALMDFNPNRENSGRVNLYKVQQGYVFLDYAHNPDGLAAIGEMLSFFKDYKKTAVLGLPGDRKNSLIEKSAHVAAQYFDRIILRDDFDLRGRSPGEIPELLNSVLTKNYPHIETQIIENENKAIEKGLNSLSEKDIVVLFYDELGPVKKTLRQFDPYPMDSIPQHEKIKEKIQNSLYNRRLPEQDWIKPHLK